MAGTPHKDASSGAQIQAKNIVLMTVGRSRITSGGKEVYSMDAIGSGAATIVQDGQKISGTWRKETSNSQTKFYTSNNEEIGLNAGNTWIEVISPDAVTYGVN